MQDINKDHEGLARSLFSDIQALIEEGRQQAATAVNFTMTMLHWRIGIRINKDILQDERAEYGKSVIATLARQLTAEYGRGFSSKNLRHMMRFATAFPDAGIVSALMRQLSWSHFLRIMYLKDPIQREFYAELCRVEGWSTRELQKKISSMLYERTALSRRPEDTVRQEIAQLREEDRLNPDFVFRDPYLLDFLGLTGAFQEKDLETAILREMEAFILELGIGFAFVARQKRITLDGDDYYIDLLFFHRRLRRMVVIELKLGEFKPADKGQMELYLRWLDKHERQPNEEAPIGMILCAGKKQEQIELLELGKSGIHVAEYLVELPPREALSEKLRKSIVAARARLDLQPIRRKR